MEPMIGEIKLFAGTFAPRGWAFCDGQILFIDKNTALYSILGTMYGGDGRTTFALPKIKDIETIDEGGQNRTENDINYIIALQGIYPSRD